MAEAKSYDKSYKEQAVKLAGKIGNKKASDELGVPYSTLYGWISGMPSSDFEKYLNYILNNTYILPIHSDPNDEDTDGDGLMDGTPQYYNFDIERKAIAPSDPSAMSYTGPENLWINQINEMKYGKVPTDYLENADGIGLSVDKAVADFLVGLLLKSRGFINENGDFFRNIALGIKNISEGNAELGAYILNFIYDEDIWRTIHRLIHGRELLDIMTYMMMYLDTVELIFMLIKLIIHYGHGKAIIGIFRVVLKLDCMCIMSNYLRKQAKITMMWWTLKFQ